MFSMGMLNESFAMFFYFWGLFFFKILEAAGVFLGL